VAGDRRPLAGSLRGGKREDESAFTAGEQPRIVHQVANVAAWGRGVGEGFECLLEHHTESAVVGVEVEQGGAYDYGGPPGPDRLGKRSHRDLVAAQHEIGRALIGEAEEPGRGLGYPEPLQCTTGLDPAASGKTGAVGGGNRPAQFVHPLRPGVVVAIREEHDESLRPHREGVLQETSGGDGLVVRMRRQHEEPIRSVEREGADHGAT
jgi:hypothetical protein